jgi:hypothetical protein
VNFTWFTSAFDPDDGVYRLTTMVQMGGGLVLAAGVPAAMTDGDFGVMTLGYVIMRLALVADWLRLARSDRRYRGGALRFATGITLVQIAWVGAGIQVSVDYDTGHFEGSPLVAGYAVALPVAVFLLAVWLLLVRGRPVQHSAVARLGHPVAAVLVLATPFLGAPVHLTAVVLAVLVAAGQPGWSGVRRTSPAHARVSG